MRIYFNKKPKYDIPYGGGNLFLINFIDFMFDHDKAFSPVFDPYCESDMMFILDPRPQPDTKFFLDISDEYKSLGKKIVLRVSDCGTHGKYYMINMYKYLIPLCDFVVFPSYWAMKYLSSNGVFVDESKSIIIQNAPSKAFFSGRKIREKNKKWSIVTHHWSDNAKKGFGVYKFLDQLLGDDYIGKKFSFTFIGRKPNSVIFNNSRYVEPLFGDELINEIGKHHIYLTASELEAGANHVQEAKAVGLPVVYKKNGGSIVEYCKDFGVSFGCNLDLIKSLNNCVLDFDKYLDNVLNFDYSSGDMCNLYKKFVFGGQNENKHRD